MLSLIDEKPMHEGWGSVWQSGEVAAVLHHQDVAEPRLVVSMIGAYVDPYAQALLAVQMGDIPDQDGHYPTLPDETLLALSAMLVDALACGMNVIIHCLEGKFRSTYLDAAVHMRVLGVSPDEAVALIRKSHPIAALRPDAHAQLLRMRDILKWDSGK